MSAARKKTEPARHVTSRDVVDALRERYSAQAGYAGLEEVRNGTGYEKSPRTADFLAMSLWPSRGLELLGFEVKVSTGDWKREREAPEKAEAIAAFCDRWWLVAKFGVVKDVAEVPAGWGFAEFSHENGLRTIREAPLLKCKPLDRLFVAAILRKAASASDDEVNRRVFAEVEKRQNSELERLKKSNAENEALLDQLRRASGWRIGTKEPTPEDLQTLKSAFGRPDDAQLALLAAQHAMRDLRRAASLARRFLRATGVRP